MCCLSETYGRRLQFKWRFLPLIIIDFYNWREVKEWDVIQSTPEAEVNNCTTVEQTYVILKPSDLCERLIFNAVQVKPHQCLDWRMWRTVRVLAFSLTWSPRILKTPLNIGQGGISFVFLRYGAQRKLMPAALILIKEEFRGVLFLWEHCNASWEVQSTKTNDEWRYTAGKTLCGHWKNHRHN